MKKFPEQPPQAPAVSPKERPETPLTAVAMRHAKRLIIFVVGLTVILLGIAVAAIPGPSPAILVVLGGLAILATEFIWARRLLKRTKARAEKMADRVSNVLPGPKCDETNPSYMRRMIMKIRVPGDEGVQPSDPPAPGDVPPV